MKIELKKMWLVARDKTGQMEMLNGEPISASPHERDRKRRTVRRSVLPRLLPLPYL